MMGYCPLMFGYSKRSMQYSMGCDSRSAMAASQAASSNCWQRSGYSFWIHSVQCYSCIVSMRPSA